MQNKDGMDDTTRTGALSLRAEINRLRKSLSEAEARAATAEEDAKKLAAFIMRRGSVRAWEHADVMRLISALAEGTVLRLLIQSKSAAARQVPASHVFYYSLAEKMRADLLAEAERIITQDIARPDLINDSMREDLRRAIGQNDPTARG